MKPPITWKKSQCVAPLPPCWYGFVPKEGELYHGAQAYDTAWYVDWNEKSKRWLVYPQSDSPDDYMAPTAYAETAEEGMAIADALYNDTAEPYAMKQTIEWKLGPNNYWRGKLYGHYTEDWGVQPLHEFDNRVKLPVNRWIVRHYGHDHDVLAYASTAEEGKDIAEAMQSEIDGGGAVSEAVEAAPPLFWTPYPSGTSEWWRGVRINCKSHPYWCIEHTGEFIRQNKKFGLDRWMVNRYPYPGAMWVTIAIVDSFEEGKAIAEVDNADKWAAAQHESLVAKQMVNQLLA